MVDSKSGNVIRHFSKQLHIPVIKDKISLVADEGIQKYVVVGRQINYDFIRQELDSVRLILREEK